LELEQLPEAAAVPVLQHQDNPQVLDIHGQ
jgi:hypothetical protein